MSADVLACPGCSRDVEASDMCWCHAPMCWPCHDDGAHHWREVEQREAS